MLSKKDLAKIISAGSVQLAPIPFVLTERQSESLKAALRAIDRLRIVGRPEDQDDADLGVASLMEQLDVRTQTIDELSAALDEASSVLGGVEQYGLKLSVVSVEASLGCWGTVAFVLVERVRPCAYRRAS
jgi:hypothetical protein